MTNPTPKVILNLVHQANHDMGAKFCEENSAQIIDSECSRVSFYSARRNLILRPNPILKLSIDNNSSICARLIHNLKRIGVVFKADKPFYHFVGHRHIRIKVDAIVESGFPEFPNGSGLIFAYPISGKEFNELMSSEKVLSDDMISKAQLSMAFGNFPVSCVFLINKASGEYWAQVVERDFNLAEKINNTVISGVESLSAPQRINTISDVQKSEKGTEKCASCYYAVHCILPESPPPICRNCSFCEIGYNGSVKCLAQGGFDLNDEMQQNLHSCTYHIYRPDILDSWATHNRSLFSSDGNSLIGNSYTNKINGSEFHNIMPSKDNGKSYTSYEIFGCKGKEIVGDKGIDKLRNMFSAKIEGKEDDISGSSIPD